MAEFHPLLWLSNVPLCVCVYAHTSLSVHLLMDTRVASILATVNSAAMNSAMYSCIFPSLCFRFLHGMEFLGHMVVLFLVL